MSDQDTPTTPEGTPATPAATPETAPSTGPVKVTFTPEQQGKVQELIDAAVGRARRDAASDLAAERAKYADYDQLKAAAAQTPTLQAKLTDTVIGAEVRLAALKAGAVDPDQVLALIDRSALTVDNDTVSNAADVVEAFLTASPHFRAAAPALPKGSGSLDGGANTPPRMDIDADIAAAEKAGNWKLATQLKTRKFLAEQRKS